jgi:glucans biosynthesis protein
MQNNLTNKCLAKTRRKTLCQTACVKGKKRCRMHGGAKGSGAPLNNKNAFKHGRYSAESIQRRLKVTRLIRQFKEMKIAAKYD